ncbi:hypothetical protein PBRA_002281 [Plasmodiophora brassicae]|uniref:Uncharacterized protein n=1 Tax=Plasmodiophora brassicae TaxID=37360 RepID=A0A0G4J409_PLABS|nr:hypothetical protein PBRA_002281 [Plasmodiophora brassicae]
MQSVSQPHEECLITLKPALGRLGTPGPNVQSLRCTRRSCCTVCLPMRLFIVVMVQSLCRRCRALLFRLLNHLRHNLLVELAIMWSSASHHCQLASAQLSGHLVPMPSCWKLLNRVKARYLKQHIEVHHRNAPTINSKGKRTPPSTVHFANSHLRTHQTGALRVRSLSQIFRPFVRRSSDGFKSSRSREQRRSRRFT